MLWPTSPDRLYLCSQAQWSSLALHLKSFWMASSFLFLAFGYNCHDLFEVLPKLFPGKTSIISLRPFWLLPVSTCPVPRSFSWVSRSCSSLFSQFLSDLAFAFFHTKPPFGYILLNIWLKSNTIRTAGGSCHIVASKIKESINDSWILSFPVRKRDFLFVSNTISVFFHFQVEILESGQGYHIYNVIIDSLIIRSFPIPSDLSWTRTAKLLSLFHGITISVRCFYFQILTSVTKLIYYMQVSNLRIFKKTYLFPNIPPSGSVRGQVFLYC